MKPNILTTWVIAPLLFVIFFVVFILIAVFDVQRDAEKTAEQMMQQTGEYLQSTMMVLQKLNTIADAPCSDSFIERLRVEVFKSDSVRDIAYVDGNRVLCSAGSGFLRSDGLLDKEDLQGAMERKFWFNMQLMQAGVRVSVTAQQLGNYVIVEYPGHFQSTIASSAYDSAVVAVSLTAATTSPTAIKTSPAYCSARLCWAAAWPAVTTPEPTASRWKCMMPRCWPRYCRC